jgi:hypothetical protein
MKHLDISSTFEFRFTAEQFTKQFPNLESLKIDRSHCVETKSSLITLLNGLKRLKTLHMNINSRSELEPESGLQCFQEHGKQLEGAKIDLKFAIDGKLCFIIEKRSAGSFLVKEKYW